MGRLVFTLFPFVFALVVHGVAAAQTPRDAATARTLFQQGLDAADAGRWEEAASRFERAQALRPSPAIALNLATAFTRLARFVEASESLRWIMRSSETTARMRRRAERRLVAVLPRLGELVVRIDAESQDADVSFVLDDEPLAVAAIGVATPVDPGAHSIVALRDEVEIASEEVQVAEAERRQVVLRLPARLVPEIRTAEIPTPEEAAQNTHLETHAPIDEVQPKPIIRRWWFWTAIAVGVGIVVGGALLGTRSRREGQSVCSDLTLGCVPL